MTLEELNKKYTPHFAANLQVGDRCIATIRHKSDGSKNIHNAHIIVIKNNIKQRTIKALFQSVKYIIPYNELQDENNKKIKNITQNIKV